VDLSGLTHLDLNGAAWLFVFRRSLARKGAALTGPELRGLPAALAPVWKLAEDTFLEAGDPPPPRSAGRVERVGEIMVGMATDLRDLTVFLGESVTHMAGALLRPWTVRWDEVSVQAEKSVVNALPVTSLVAFLVGLVLAFQAAPQMQAFGIDIYVADLVGLSIIRELGTLLTAIVLAGRSGSAFSSELASMKTNQEIDAVLTMGLSPVRDLALPRILALTFTTPLLTVFADLAGLMGGNVVMRLSLGYPIPVFWSELSSHLDLSDITTGLFKAFVFGFTVAVIGCQRGLYSGDSPSAIGEATTRGVVTNIIAIAVLDSLFAVLFYARHW
jgi:phospholipid/cholesterol/gamma-HCH transport system permease protein